MLAVVYLEFLKTTNIGTHLRNAWNLWRPESPIVADVKKTYKLFGHGDDASGLIMTGAWALVRGKDIDTELAKTAKRYREHWKRAGLNPETGERI